VHHGAHSATPGSREAIVSLRLYRGYSVVLLTSNVSYYNNDCYYYPNSCHSGWYNWGRWVVCGVIILAFIVALLLLAWVLTSSRFLALVTYGFD
jgi:hypothetical protein